MESLKRELGEDERVREVLEQIIENPDGAESTLKEHGLNPAMYRTAMSISPEAHVRMQAAWQNHVTNSVSKTINLPSSATVDDVRSAYELAWETGCKAVTVYRDGSKSMQVLETSSEASEEDEVTVEQPGLLMPRDRPTSVAGVTDLVRTGHGNMYVNITFDEEGNPFEVFTTLGKAGRMRLGEPGGCVTPGVARAAVRDRPGRYYSPPPGDHLLPCLGWRDADTLGP